MPHFVDSKSRKWELTVTVGSAKRVLDSCGVKILELYGEKTLTQVFADPIKLVDVLYVLCSPQCDAQGVDDIEFGESMVGDVLEDASNALLESVAAFFPSGKKAALLKIHQSVKKMAALMEAQELRTLDEAERAITSQAATA